MNTLHSFLIQFKQLAFVTDDRDFISKKSRIEELAADFEIELSILTPAEALAKLDADR